MSVRFKILKPFISFPAKRMFGLPQEKLFAKAAQLNAKRGFAVPTDKKHVYTDVRVGERGHCLKIRQPGTQRDKAMLFLFGGGMVIGPDAGDRKAACQAGFPLPAGRVDALVSPVPQVQYQGCGGYGTGDLPLDAERVQSRKHRFLRLFLRGLPRRLHLSAQFAPR